jgi:hypothetical protein
LNSSESRNILQLEIEPLKCLQAATGPEMKARLPAILDKAFKGEF